MTGLAEPVARMVDIAFAVEGDDLPREHRRALAAAVEAALPWLAGLPGAGIHRLNVSTGDGAQALLSGRTRLTLRLPHERVADAAALSGTRLQVGTGRLRVGAAQPRDLLPHGTLYAHLVVAEGQPTDTDTDTGAQEAAFLQSMDRELRALGVPCRLICGRRQVVEPGVLQGFSLMLDGLSAEDALRVLEAGLGAHRRLGCGVFVPHKSASAVGAPS